MPAEAMRADRARHGLRANGLGPGHARTEPTKPLADDPVFSDWSCRRAPAGRWGNAEELGGAVVVLAAPVSDLVNGQVLYVDGSL